MATNSKAQRPAASPAAVRRMRTALTDAGSAARRTLRGLRGGTTPAIDEGSLPEATAGADDGQAARTAAPDRSALGPWLTVKRARLAIVITLAVAHAVLALISWRIRVSRARRRGQPGEQVALEDLGTKLGDIAGKLDASSEG